MNGGLWHKAKNYGMIPVIRSGEEGKMKEYRTVALREEPELMEKAASWFHEKWGVPRDAYLGCMKAYLNRET